MFKSAKIKLTTWYVAIIMLISIAFSTFAYMGIAAGTKRALEVQHRRFERQYIRFERPEPLLDIDALIEIRNKTLITLIIFNVAVLVISWALGYFLAGKTLKPIENMLEKQKRFVSDAAHELKTPITAAKTELEVALRDKKLSPENAKIVLNSAVEEMDKLHSLVNLLLAHTKYQIQSGSPRACPWHQLIQACLVKKTSLRLT